MRLVALSLPLLLSLTFACAGENISGGNKTTDDTGTSEEGVGNLVVEVEAIDFGTTEVGELKSEAMLLENAGTGPVVVESISASLPFSVSITGLTIQPGATAHITVYFQPTDYEDATGELAIVSDDEGGGSTIALAGQVITDGDGDGHLREEAGGDDCDDDDPDVYPGAPEQYYDGVDADCLGDDDYDQDGDGYQSDVFNDDPGLGGGDCNDSYDDMYPGAPDEVYDGIDSDCAGDDDYDYDGDGYGSADYDRGRDCDDFDADVYPGAIEQLDGDLDDCDGEVDRDIHSTGAVFTWTGEGADEEVGTAVAMGDIDGDGLGDLIVGAAGYNSGGGAVGTFLTTSGIEDDWDSLRTGSTDFFSGSGIDGIGSALVLLDDFDGDDEADLLVGAPSTSSSYGAIYVIGASDLAAGGDTGDASLTISGTSSFYYVGRSMAGNMDLDGDGTNEILFEYRTSTSNTHVSNLGLQYGGSGQNGTITGTSVDSYWTTGSSSSTYASAHSGYLNLTGGEDLDGDGLDDFVYCDPFYDTNSDNTGSVWALWGSPVEYAVSGSAFASSTGEVVVGDSQYGWMGDACGLLPDMDDDGDGELWAWKGDVGELYVWSGGTDLRNGSVGDGDAQFVMELSSDWTTSGIEGIGDWNGDGHGDWALAIDGDSASIPGGLTLLTGWGLEGLYEDHEDESIAIATFDPDGDDGSDLFAQGFPQGVADVDGDGFEDLLIGDPGFSYDLDGDDEEEDTIGAAYLFYNPGS